jgi:RNA polymerase sigma-70 factor (TIGR02960 family)
VAEFDELVRAHRAELLVHCYRLLGSRTDAEDVLQEVMLAAWRGLDGFEGRSSVRSWLYRIATNRCLNAIRDRGRRVPVAPVPPFEPPKANGHNDIPWLEPFPDALLDRLPDAVPGPEARYTTTESVELAFVGALQRMPPRQAAVLVLCDVLGYPLAEVAPMLSSTPTAVKGLLQRARAALPAEPPPRSSPDDPVVRRFAEAFIDDDIDAVVELLTDDVWLSMPPASQEYLGVAAAASFLRASAAWRTGPLTMEPARFNAQPAYAYRIGDRPGGLIVLTLRDSKICGITRFLTHT